MLRFVLVTVGIIVLTSFTIDATDALRGSQSALSILADRATQEGCPAGMVSVADFGFCIDVYELSTSADCSAPTPRSSAESAQNVNNPDCLPESKTGVLPWTNVTVTQAKALCAKVGKRLPTSLEWYQAALGTPDTKQACNIAGDLSRTGSQSCISGAGVHDMIGNVWELIDGTISDGRLEDMQVPEEGYVDSVYDSGIARTTTSTPQIVYGNDYFWSDTSGVHALMRGGFHGSGPDAGVYTTHAAIDQNFASNAIGFRCAISL